MKTPTSILRLVPHLIPLPSDRSLPLASSLAQLQRPPIESKQHNTIREQRSTSINNIRSDVYWPHINVYHKICKNVEENLNSFINIKKKKNQITLRKMRKMCSRQKHSVHLARDFSRGLCAQNLAHDSSLEIFICLLHHIILKHWTRLILSLQNSILPQLHQKCSVLLKMREKRCF